MPSLFAPIRLGSLEIKNRFVASATSESMATETGQITEPLIRRYRTLARGEVGLVLPGYLYVHPLGRAAKFQAGIYHDELIPGLRRLTAAVHDQGGRIVFQLAHAGRQTTRALIGRTPLGASARGWDPAYLVRPVAMNEEQIGEAIGAFAQAARRAVEAGADGVQLHAAHGYLLSQFLSPYWNVRTDAWGGSDENRFRLLKETVLAVKQALPPGMPLLVKLNSHDHTPKPGITPPLAAAYARWLAELGLDGLELSCGSMAYSFANMSRGEIPVDEMARALPGWMRPVARIKLQRMAGRFDLVEGYNVPAARLVKPAVGDVPLLVVGGLRRLEHMESLVEDGPADLVSLCRPFIREPALVRRFREGKTEAAGCTSCNRCLPLLLAGQPLRCMQQAAGG